MSSLWDSLVDAICRPPRDDAYSPEDLVGGADGRFSAAGRSYVRWDSVLVNRRGRRVVWSLFEATGERDAPAPFPPAPRSAVPSGPRANRPVVVYAHCNSGSRRDAEEVLGLLLPSGVSVAALDFTGSGLSEGRHVTLGCRESEDLEDLVAHLADARGEGCRIAVWGRSMGAVAALLAASAEARRRAAAAATSASSSSQNRGRISAVVLDSPFASLPELMAELVARQRLLPLFPKALLSSRGLLLSAMARSVRKRAGFDLRDVVPIRAVSSSSSVNSKEKGARSGDGGTDGDVFASLLPPALFGHAELDTFISSSHSRRLHDRYAGRDKAMCAFAGDHNTARPASFRSAALGFLKEALFETTATAATRVESSDNPLLASAASLGAAKAFDDDFITNTSAPGHPASFGAVASGHATDERDAWGRAGATAAASAAASAPSEVPSFSSTAYFLPRRSSEGDEGDDEEREMVQRAIAASLELSRALAEREAREAKEAALAAAGVAADAAAQLREEQEERERRRQRQEQQRKEEQQREEEQRRRRQQQRQPPPAPDPAPAPPSFASFDLTQEQRELHAFFSPPSPVAGRAPEGPQRQELPPPKRQLRLPKAPPAIAPSPSPSSSDDLAAKRGARSLEARAGGGRWKS